MEIVNCTREDFNQILQDIVDFWGSDRTLHLHHPMFVNEFGNSAFVIRDGRRVLAYFFGFLSQTEPVAYGHLMAVRSSHQGKGMGRRLYEHFFDFARQHGYTSVKGITTPKNAASIAFHKALGFRLEGEQNADGIPVMKDYAGVGNDRVVFRRDI